MVDVVDVRANMSVVGGKVQGRFRESRSDHLHKPMSHHKNDLELELVAM